MHEKIYSSRAWDVVRWLQIDGLLARCYWPIKVQFENYSYKQTVRGVEAEFKTTSGSEYTRVQNLVGERPVLEAFLQEIESDDVVYDVGANIGLYSCFALQAIDTGSVIAFEPEPENRERAEYNLSRNADQTDYSVLPVALSDSDGEAELELKGGVGDGKHTLNTSNTGQKITIQTCRLDTLIAQDDIPQPNVMKIDVEGAEAKVLDGAEDTLSDVRSIICEVHTQDLQKFESSSEEIETKLNDSGFSTERISAEGRNQYHLLARKN